MSPNHRDCSRRPGRVGSLLPWLFAPAWVFLPMGGCGVAKTMLKRLPDPLSRAVAADHGGAAAAGSPLRVESTMTVAAAARSAR